MAIASYTTDLTTIAIGSLGVDAGTWDESTDAGWDTGGAMVDDANLYYNGTACVSAQMTKDSNGTGATGPATIMYTHTAAFTIPTDGAALIHHLWAAPPALNTLANAGIIVLAGTTFGDFYGWNASGSDFAPAPKGGWANYAINPAIGTPDHTVGTITTYNMIGMAVAATAQARGNPNACNAVRYGRCESIITDGDLANGYATFEGFALEDNISTNRWSLIDPVEGGYKWQGLMSVGTTATPVDFRDANRNISITNTINVTTAFNAIEINNASSNVEWTAISISALGTNSKGTFAVIDNATVTKTSCTFTDMDTFVYQSNSTINTTTFRRCNTITTGGAIFNGSIFDSSTSTGVNGSINVSSSTDISALSNITFNNYTGRYGIYIPATVTGTVTFNNWQFDGTGTDVYWAGLTGTLTVALTNGANASTFLTAAPGTSTVAFENSVALSITNLRANTEVRIYRTSDNSVLGGIEDAVTLDWLDTSVTPNVQYYKHVYSYNAGVLGGVDTYIMIFNKDYLDIRLNYTLLSENASLLIQQTFDRVNL